MSFYDDMQIISTDLLSEFQQGRAVYVHVTPGSGPKDEPGDPIETPYAFGGTAKGVSYKYVQGGLAVASDLQITMPVIAVDPDMRGFVEWDDKRFKIVQVMPIPPFGTRVATRLIIRK